VVDPIRSTPTNLQPGRLLVAGLLAVAAFALLVSFVSASEWRIDADLKFLAAIGGTMLNLVTGCIVYAAIRLRRTPPAISGVLDEDFLGRDVEDSAGAAEDRDHQRQLQ